MGQRILEAGLVPILEPEVDIRSPQTQEAEQLLFRSLSEHLAQLTGDHQVMLKLTIPSEDGFYGPLTAHPKVLRGVALSGGYSRDEANGRPARNPGLVASFSRRGVRHDPRHRRGDHPPGLDHLTIAIATVRVRASCSEAQREPSVLHAQ